MTLRYLHESITFALSVQILLVCFLLSGIYFLSKRVEVYPLQTGDLHILLSNSYCSHQKGRRTVHFKRYLNLHKLDAVSKVDGYYSNCVKFIANEVSSLSRFAYIVGVFFVIVNCHGHFWRRLLSFNKEELDANNCIPQNDNPRGTQNEACSYRFSVVETTCLSHKFCHMYTLDTFFWLL